MIHKSRSEIHEFGPRGEFILVETYEIHMGFLVSFCVVRKEVGAVSFRSLGRDRDGPAQHLPVHFSFACLFGYLDGRDGFSGIAARSNGAGAPDEADV